MLYRMCIDGVYGKRIGTKEEIMEDVKEMRHLTSTNGFICDICIDELSVHNICDTLAWEIDRVEFLRSREELSCMEDRELDELTDSVDLLLKELQSIRKSWEPSC